MDAHTESIVKSRQNPLRDRYHRSPGDAWISDAAQTRNACGEDPFHGTVMPANGSSAPWRFGIHRAVGGYHDHPNPGDILCAALAACFDSTLRMLADHLGIRLESLEVAVTAECDVRGCLLVGTHGPRWLPAHAVPRAAATQRRCRSRTDQGPSRRSGTQLRGLQTLRNGVAVETQANGAEET